MSTSIKRCPKVLCSQVFQVNRFSGNIARLFTYGRVICPHCGYAVPGDANSIFLTHAVSREEEERFVEQERMENARRA